MGLLSTIVGALFGGPKAAQDTVAFVADAAKGVGTWIDERNFTEEEKSKADQKNLETVLRGIELTRDENSARSVTRRYLAWSIMGIYLLSFLLTISVGYFVQAYGKFILEVIQVYGLDKLAWAVGSFYFLASISRSIKAK